MEGRAVTRPTGCASRLAILALLAIAPAFAGDQAPADATPWHWTDVSRIVAFGDVHGAYDALVSTLRALDVIDDGGAWTGGTSHLVSLGDVPDRGPESRRVLDLLMRLQTEAARAGGGAHLVLGNHEVMNVIGDLRYVAREEYAAFAGDEPADEREAAFERYVARRNGPRVGKQQLREEFDARYPPGFFGHRAAFSRDGKYGAWILRQPAVIVIDDTAFVHGGLPPVVAELGAEVLNRRVAQEIRSYLDALEVAERAGIVPPEASLAERSAILTAHLTESPDVPWKEAAERLLRVSEMLAHNDSGPLWYRATATGEESPEETSNVVAALARLGVARAVVGHSVTEDRRIQARFDGRVLLIDTGMLASHYGGQPSALVIEGETVRAFYTAGNRFETISAREAGEAAPPETPPEASDLAAERFLATAEVVKIEELGTGVTRPKRVTLRADGRETRAVFKTVDQTDPGARNALQKIQFSDRYQYELAAYKLDRMLGLDMVPVTVAREIDGEKGALQAWIEGGVNELVRAERNLHPSDRAQFDRQIERMHLFDVLIYNTDRNQQNLLYTPVDERVHLIDHTRAFRVNKGRPESARKAVFMPAPEVVAALESIDRGILDETLGDLLQPVQIKALLQRRDAVLEEMLAGAAAPAAK